VPTNSEIYSRQIRAFRLKFGREMRPEDPFFFDPESDSPSFRPDKDAHYVVARLAKLLEEAGAEPAHVYAFRKTGGLLPPDVDRLTPAERAEWEAAVAEYHRGAREEFGAGPRGPRGQAEESDRGGKRS